MLKVVLLIALILFVVVLIYITYKKRKKAGVKGLKSELTSIYFFTLAILNLLAYWLNFGGIIIWLISIALLLVAAYFTKYIPISKKVH
ncbi:hypothetical protein Q9B79_06720 [Bacillus sp. MHSD_36]|uniref:hypothetical protein n=1 Tax=unclassified Bacillus (in: firmicutes) TaxID=185979 RepID=UPI0027425620|nr:MULTISPECIES: hypothetical protein [unclassified Bacillus (in: firmicutes)]MDP7989474.1 hypothetical protein [Bacillus sp. MHSD_36]MDR4977252.1 hypothetical protein [Bacillus sp. MHSD_37]